MRELWLVRHGETVWNAEHKLTGWADPPLTPKGEEQARALCEFLSEQSYDSVWSSDLQRARRTAELAFGTPNEDRRLREIDFGELDGLDWHTLDATWRDSLLQSFDEFHPPGGEHASDFTRRVVEFVEELPPGRHLVFTHGGVVRLLMRLLGQDQFLPNASVACLRWDERAVLSVRQSS
jgi:probable phosphoglycerate mutase